MTTITLDRHKGHAFDYDVVSLGYNYRMSELNAALGLVQLKRVSERNARRGELTEEYRKRLTRIDGLAIPFSNPRGLPGFHILPVLLPEWADRHEVMAGLKRAGIQTSIHYRPIDTFSAYREAGLGPSSSVPLTHSIGAHALTLPLFPSMSSLQVQQVCDQLSQVLTSVGQAALAG